MKIINNSNDQVIYLLGGKQIKRPGRYYRHNKYLLNYQYDDETILILNMFTGSFVELKTYEYKNIFTDIPCDYADYLVANYFIVPKDFDEDFWIEEIRNRLKRPITDMYLDHLNHFTILTTTKCNARCPYCYENKLKKKQDMTEETAEKVAQYIIENYNINNDSIQLLWFGGEPLYNENIINIICSRIKSFKIKFTSSIITNGYLFNEKNLDKVVNEWHVNNMQITLDGVNEKYNKVKNYIYKDDPNPFEKVINNIDELIKRHIYINIRMNVDNNNAEDIKELAIYLCKKFKNHPDKAYLSIYSNKIYNCESSLKYQEELVNHLLEIDQILLDNKFYSKCTDEGIRYVHCQVDNGQGVLITPTGEIGLCQGTIEGRLLGHIDNPIDLDIDLLKHISKFEENNMDICENCVMKPACVRLTYCTDMRQCDKIWKDYKIKVAILEMINSYERHISNEKYLKENNCNNKCNCEKPVNHNYNCQRVFCEKVFNC